jgi:hypothetical protein
MHITIATLAAYLMAAMLSFTPTSQHAYYEKSAVTSERYATIANDLAVVMLAQDMPDAERLKVGSVMVSIGDAESHWNADVVACKKGGDNDRAWGPWQTQLPKAEVCKDTRSAATLALGMVRYSLAACKRMPLGDRLSWYTDGRCMTKWQRSRYRLNRALAWVNQHPFTVNVTPFGALAVDP